MRIQLKGPGHAATLLADLNRCRQVRQYCDVFLQVGSRTFAAHRAVLACAGTYFHTLFTRPPAAASTLFTLEFISPLNFEKVLTFVYTGEILIDLIDVGVLYELAERLGVGELMRACHATFPDLQASVSAKAGGGGDLHLDSDMIITASEVTAITAASVCSSSCSSLSSSAGPSAAPTPSTASSPLFQARTEPKVQTMVSSLDLKMEDVQSHISCEQVAANVQLQESPLLPSSSLSNQMEGVQPPGPVLQLKTESDLGDGGAARGSEDCVTRSEVISESATGSLLRSCNPALSDSSSLPDSSAQLGAEALSSPSGSLQVVSVEGGAMNKDGDDSLLFGKVETGPTQDNREVLRGNGAMEGTEEEFPPWRQMVGEIIELSDDETYMEDEEDEDDEDDLVCVENDERGEEGTMSQGSRNMSCKACSAPLPADPFAIRQHGESHLTELGLCGVCGASFPDRAASISHALSHVGVPLFTCNMCHLQFCSQNKLLRHHHHTASGYSLPQEALNTGRRSLGSELKCAVCTKTLSKRFQSVRDHLLSHVCHQSLTCGVCHLPQLSLCSLLWHALTHLSVPIFSCPHCARCFVERPLLDRHMAEHAKEAAAKERKLLERGPHRAGAGAVTGVEEIQCFLCSQTFSTSSAFQHHLSLHTTKGLGSGGGGPGVQGWSGKRKADQTLEGPPSCCSSSIALHDTSKLSKTTTLGLGLSVPEKLFQVPSLFSTVLTNGTSEKEDAAEAPGLRGKWYRCRYCGKHFAHSGEFTYHLRIHTGEKPYQCKVCLRFFRGRSTMICHLKTHAGALMYRCTVCGFYFSTLKLVSSHMELHKDHLPPDFNIEQTFMYNDHSKEALRSADT